MASLLTFLLVGLGALVALSIILAIVGAVLGLAFGLAGFLLFKVAPVVLVGYLIVRFLTPKSKRLERLERAERKWIEGG
jgi:hypothetical protein